MGAPFQLQWAAYFPLVGSAQTVPRTELDALVVLVRHVLSGVLYVVSDSDVNVSTACLVDCECGLVVRAL